ncbi:uncharacterized protein [Drosophila bipectinata]|uniref:uncharacterized protein n=1 Tax=Drosophila bipectinata TaxID=42026 RepID=UPI0038B2AF3E
MSARIKFDKKMIIMRRKRRNRAKSRRLQTPFDRRLIQLERSINRLEKEVNLYKKKYISRVRAPRKPRTIVQGFEDINFKRLRAIEAMTMKLMFSFCHPIK